MPPSVFEAKRIALGQNDGSRYANRFLVLDFTDSEFRVSFWTRHQLREVSVTMLPTDAAWQAAQQNDWVPKSDRRGAWIRQAARGTNLGDCLRLALDLSPFSWRTIEAYIRLTGWGSELP